MGEIADYMRNDLIDNDEKDRKEKGNEKGLKLEEFNSVLKAKISPKRQKQPSQSDVAANFNVKAESFVPKKPTKSSRIETKLFEIDTKKIPYDVLRKNCEKNYKKSNFEAFEKVAEQALLDCPNFSCHVSDFDRLVSQKRNEIVRFDMGNPNITFGPLVPEVVNACPYLHNVEELIYVMKNFTMNDDRVVYVGDE